MKTKMGRPTLPKGKAKGAQVGVRFNAKEIKQVEKTAAEEQQDKAKWLRKVALEATQEWIKCNEWSVEDLHGKTVEFELFTILEGAIKGTGKFDIWKSGEGLVKIRIVTFDRKSTQYVRHELCIYVPQRGVQFIKRQPAGSKCDFSVIDPAVQKYVRGQM